MKFTLQMKNVSWMSFHCHYHYNYFYFLSFYRKLQNHDGFHVCHVLFLPCHLDLWTLCPKWIICASYSLWCCLGTNVWRLRLRNIPKREMVCSWYLCINRFCCHAWYVQSITFILFQTYNKAMQYFTWFLLRTIY